MGTLSESQVLEVENYILEFLLINTEEIWQSTLDRFFEGLKGLKKHLTGLIV